MLDHASGHIVNIASLAGRNAVPQAAAYAASKHAVLGFSKSLFAEVRAQGVRVTAVCPGSVVTPFFEKSGVSIERPEAKLQPEDIADTVVAVLELPDRALISELDIRPANP
jgi:3-oxoacyl-[acyl-carrier protein] reductase